MTRVLIATLVVIATSVTVSTDEPTVVTAFGGEDWPRWRGPRGDGTLRGPQLYEKWPDEGLPVRWRQPIGPGYAGVTAAANRVYTMDREDESERVLCFDATTGKPLWNYRYGADYGDLQYGKGPRATPTVAGEFVYTWGSVGHLHCLTAETGKLIWSKEFKPSGMDKDRDPIWGLSASPVLFEDLVIIQAGAKPDGCLIALNRTNGNEVWRSVADAAGYTTPILIERNNRQELVCWTAKNVLGIEPRTGKVHWSIPFDSTMGTAIATPIYRENMVFVASYWDGSKAIRLGDKPGDAKVVWEENRNLRGLMSQPLYRDGYGYLLDKRYGVTCFEFKTGKKLWDDANTLTPRGRNPQVTLVWTGEENRVVALNSNGELVLAEFSPKGYREISRTKIIGETWAHPAYAWGHVFARSDAELVAVRIVPE